MQAAKRAEVNLEATNIPTYHLHGRKLCRHEGTVCRSCGSNIELSLCAAW